MAGVLPDPRAARSLAGVRCCCTCSHTAPTPATASFELVKRSLAHEAVDTSYCIKALTWIL
eukprot:2401813-Pyramimonas_sp.AAC.1